jgi:hypothetical protein
MTSATVEREAESFPAEEERLADIEQRWTHATTQADRCTLERVGLGRNRARYGSAPERGRGLCHQSNDDATPRTIIVGVPPCGVTTKRLLRVLPSKAISRPSGDH